MIKKLKLAFIALAFSIPAVIHPKPLFATTMKDAPKEVAKKIKSPELLAREQTAKLSDFLALSETQTLKVYEINLGAANKAKTLEKKNLKDRKKRQKDAQALKLEIQSAYKGVFTEKQYKKYLKRQKAVETQYEAQQARMLKKQNKKMAV